MDKLHHFVVLHCGSVPNTFSGEVVMDRQLNSRAHSGTQTGTQMRSIGGMLSWLVLTLLLHSQPLQAQSGSVLSSPAPVTAAASFPQRPLTLVVPFPPGGGTDTTARLLAKRLSDNLGQQVLIDNKPGGGGVAGAVAVRNAPADGHTLFIGHVGTHAIDIHLHSKLGYDPVADFTPISSFMSFLSLLVVPANSPARNFAELVALAKSKPGGLSFASQGHGTAGHFLGEMMKTATGAPMVHIPMKGGAPAVAETVAGRTDLLFSSYISSGAFLREGKLRALAYAAPKRAPALPEVPTLVELGVRGVEFDQWFAVFAPARLPEALTRRLNEEVIKAVRHPELVAAIDRLGAEVITSSPEGLARLIAQDTVRYGEIVRRIGAKLD